MWMELTDALRNALPVKSEKLGPIDKVLKESGSTLASFEGSPIIDGSSKVCGSVDILVVDDELVEESVVSRYLA